MLINPKGNVHRIMQSQTTRVPHVPAASPNTINGSLHKDCSVVARHVLHDQDCRLQRKTYNSVELAAIHACFHAFICSGYKPLVRQYSLTSTSDKVAVSNTMANFSSADHLSDGMTFDTEKPVVLNCFCQLYSVERFIPSCRAN